MIAATHSKIRLLDRPPCLTYSDLDTVSETPLRICCYGASSKETPQKYLVEAHALGLTLARRGHTCVNGAGSFGCMGAMNEGAAEGNGCIVGVIHEMFVLDGSDWIEGSHAVFHAKVTKEGGRKREILVAGGMYLQQRKKMLLDGADGVAVLPGGPGTWDELWEIACERNLGMSTLPIVCVNVDGYYDPFKLMLKRAHEDKLVKLQPDDIIHFEDTALGAVKWLEEHVKLRKMSISLPQIEKRRQIRRDFFRLQSWSCGGCWEKMSTYCSRIGDKGSCFTRRDLPTLRLTFAFVAGLTLGAVTFAKRGTTMSVTT